MSDVSEQETRSGRWTILLNAVFILIAALGVVVMIAALVIAFRHPTPSSRALATPSISATEDSDIPELKLQSRTYTFSKASDLKAFKQHGIGEVSIVGGRMRIKTYPATTKSVSLTVHVTKGSTLRFDDEHSGDVDYDGASFFLDGWALKNETGTASGSAKYQVYELDPGEHTFTWQYKTDTTIVLASDAYYVDNIQVTKILPPGWY